MNINVSQNINFQGKFKPLRVDKKLFRGESIVDPHKLIEMKKMGITQIIDLRGFSLIEKPLERLLCKLLGIKYVNYKYPNSLNNLPQGDLFEKINQSILTNKGQTYIHGQHGKHRTGIAVAIYERLNSKQSPYKIIYNLLKNGYYEIAGKGNPHNREKYVSIYKEMLEKYF